jgi:sporulation protein YhbH
MSNTSNSSENLSDIWKIKRRGKRDSDRHKELVKEAIRKNGKDIITEYNIITSDGDKKIKIPIKFLDQYKIKYGKPNNQEGTGQGVKAGKGDKFKIKNNQDDDSASGKAGNKEGDRTFDADVTIDELVDIMLEELKLPWMSPKQASSIEVENEEFSSINKKGIMPNLDIKKTILENLKRNAAKGEAKIKDFHQEDFRYKTYDITKEYHSNASVYIMMDRSGSMDNEKTYIAKSFYFWMVQFLKRKYKKIDFVFIAHDSKAFIVDEQDFFKISSSGGTNCSTAFELALSHMQINHPPENWNNYVFEFSDGDNWGEDNNLCIQYIEKLLPLCTAIGYGEISRGSWNGIEVDTLYDILKSKIKRTRFVSLKIKSKDEVFDALRAFFNIDGISKKEKNV